MSCASLAEPAVGPAPRVVPQIPLSDTDALGETIAALAARLHAATYELLVLLAEFDGRNGWHTGFLSCAHWLHWRTGIDLGAAREKVRVARALPALPLVSACMRQGQLSYAKVRALTRVTTPANEQSLVDVALVGTAAHVERFVRAWRRVDRTEEARETETRHLRRQLSTWVDDDGMIVIRGRLTPEAGAVVLRALEAAADRLFRDGASAPGGHSMAEEVTPAQRQADALGLLAEVALSANLDAGSAGGRYQVVVHVTTETHAPDAAAVGRADVRADTFDGVLELDHDAVHVSAETSRRPACDASVVTVDHDPTGTVLSTGRKTRTIPPSIRRALAARDSQCRFPGCTSRRCDAHHLAHWADGGPTSLENLVLLCRLHHRSVHEGGFRVVRRVDGAVSFERPDATRLDPAPLLPPTDARWTDYAAAPCPSIPVWDGTPFDLAWALDIVRGRRVVLKNENEDEEGCGSCGNRSVVSKELVGAWPA